MVLDLQTGHKSRTSGRHNSDKEVFMTSFVLLAGDELCGLYRNVLGAFHIITPGKETSIVTSFLDAKAIYADRRKDVVSKNPSRFLGP